MGKKSNTKKLARELAKEKEEKELKKKRPFKKKSKKEIKREAAEKAKKQATAEKTEKTSSKKQQKNKKQGAAKKKQTSKKQVADKKQQTPKKQETKQKIGYPQRILKSLRKNKKRIFAGMFVVIMVAILVVVAALLFQKAFRPQPIAKFLPAKYTVATLEINSNPTHHQITKTFNLLKNHPQYSKNALVEYVDERFGLDYEKELSLWLGRSLGMAVLNFGNAGGVKMVYFTEFISKSNLKDFLAQQTVEEEGYKDHRMYFAKDGYYMTKIADYLFIAEEKDTLKKIIDSREKRDPVLYRSPQYRRIDNNLPVGKLAFAYINYEAVSDAFFKHFPELSEQGLSMRVIQPLIDSFKAEGIALIAMDDNFAIQSFLSLSDKVVDQTATYLSAQKKYRAELLEYVSPEVIAFWGGENLETQMKRLIKVISGGDLLYISGFETLMKNYVEKYFGADTDLEEDIFPIARNEFLMALEEGENGGTYKLITDLSDSQAKAVKVHEMAEKFAEIGAVFEPKIVEHTLPDGTVGREIIAVPKQITREESEYGEYKIFELNMGEENKSLYYTIAEGIAIITNSKDSIKQSLDLFDVEGESLKDTIIFEKQIEPVIRNSDEVSYLRADKLIPLFLEEHDLPEFTEIILSLSSGRNYFHDGIVTINYLHIK